jgi:hypothetical protein
MTSFFSKFFSLISAALFFSTLSTAQQCLSGDCQKGYGKALFQDSTIYEGEFKEGFAHGKGIMVKKGGLTLEGNFEAGKPHGKCFTLLANGDKYNGDYVKGDAEGYGVYTARLGDKYEGNFKAGKLHGFGKYYYKDGSTYEGNWENGLKHGSGKEIFKNGDKYEGEFVNDKKQGKGAYYSANGDVYTGEFLNDFKTGKGKFTMKSGDVMEGQFAYGFLNGEGVWKLSNGTVMTGNWKSNRFDGLTKINYFNKDLFEGETKYSTDVAKGKFFKNGKLFYEGNFGADRFPSNDSVWLLPYSGTFIRRLSFKVSYPAESDFYEYYLPDGKIYMGGIKKPTNDNSSSMSDLKPNEGIIIFPDGNIIGGTWRSKLGYRGGWDTAGVSNIFYKAKRKISDADFQYLRGIAAAKIYQQYVALKYFTEAINKKLPNDSVYYYRAIAYRNLPDYKLGIADMNSFISKPPKNSMPYKYLAIMHKNDKDTAGAILVYDKYIKQFPADTTVYQERGLLYEATKQYEKALADYTKAISLKKGNNSWSYFRRAKCYDLLGKIPEACAELKLVNDPINPNMKKESDKLAQLLKCQ